MSSIHSWFALMARALGRPPRVVEVGVHHGTDTARLAQAAGEMEWIGLEPDPRNVAVLRAKGLRVVEAAASWKAGTAELWLSSGETPGCPGREHTDSSSLCQPTAHLEAHPWCTFGERVEVPTVRLDDVVPEGWAPDLLWVDVQGAQRQVLCGGRAVLARTRYLYIECHPTPLYEGEPTFEELCGLLPGWEVVTRWPADILFSNGRPEGS